LKSAKKMQEKGCRDVLSRLWAADFSGLNLLMTRKRLRNWAQDPNNNQQVFDFVNKIKYNSVEDLRRQLGGMKFDIVVGNPPYQRNDAKKVKLWVGFLELSMEFLVEDGYVG
jgi:16S rRNA G966 N2-methylase RsmD